MSVKGSQSGLAEAFLHPSVGRNLQLETIAKRIDWRVVEASMRNLRSGERGSPPYPALMMVKALLLQQWYGLSDTGLEEALLDRMSFRRFVGLSGDEAAPDHSTLWRFRQALSRQGLDKAVLSPTIGYS
jgi:transposase, IS5 family